VPASASASVSLFAMLFAAVVMYNAKEPSSSALRPFPIGRAHRPV
jgi:hypothetical protein